MTQHLSDAIQEHKSVLDSVLDLNASIDHATQLLHAAFSTKNKVLVCGNGGSASDAQHFASELTGRFEKNRLGYPAFALTTDSSALTAIGNDYGFDRVFARQLESVGCYQHFR